MAYTKVGWKNGASGGTPINAANLEHMDAQILQNTNDIATLNSNTYGIRTYIHPASWPTFTIDISEYKSMDTYHYGIMIYGWRGEVKILPICFSMISNDGFARISGDDTVTATIEGNNLIISSTDNKTFWGGIRVILFR